MQEVTKSEFIKFISDYDYCCNIEFDASDHLLYVLDGNCIAKVVYTEQGKLFYISGGE